MSSVAHYQHPTHAGHTEWSKDHGHVMVHKWAHGGPDVRKTYASAEKAKSALHRAVKAGNVPLKEDAKPEGEARAINEAHILARRRR